MEEKKKGFFSRLVAGLTKTRENIVSGIDSIFSGFSAIDEDFYEELEDALLLADCGVKATTVILDELREQVKKSVPEADMRAALLKRLFAFCEEKDFLLKDGELEEFLEALLRKKKEDNSGWKDLK